MTASYATAADSPTASGSPARQISVLLYSDDKTTRDAVRVTVGRRPARDVEVGSWRECATAAAVVEAVENASFDVLVLDGEAAPMGGLGLCRQLKSEIFECPPILVLTGSAPGRLAGDVVARRPGGPAPARPDRLGLRRGRAGSRRTSQRLLIR